MPLKRADNVDEKKKKQHDLGLDIFELKKEMGFFGYDKSISIEKILTERSKKKQKIQ